jgi:DNA gyrase/topoisomerase IV subunit A
VNTTTIKITELPIGYFLDDYKKILFKLQDDGIIKDFENHSTDSTFEFLVNVPRTTTTLNHEELISKFKLTSKMTQNFTLWSADNHIRVFDDAQEIINYFVEFRLSKYEERRLKLMQIYNAQYDWLCEKKKFIEWYIVNSKIFSSKNKKELVELLSDNGFINIQDLLEIKLYNLTKDDITKLENNIIKIENDIAALAKTNAAKMYKKELNDLKL